MKNKIAFGMTACGILTFLVGAAGVEAKGQAGYVAFRDCSGWPGNCRSRSNFE